MQFASTPGNQGKGKGVVPGLYALLGDSNGGQWLSSTQSICDRCCIYMCGWEGYGTVPR